MVFVLKLMFFQHVKHETKNFFTIFASMNDEKLTNQVWGENVIIADADYVDSVAFDLIVNFERIINRRIPPADMSQWLVCIDLDGGVKPRQDQAENPSATHVVLIHSKQNASLKNFIPSHYANDLDGKAFKDPALGEFCITALPVEDKMVSLDDLFLDIVGTVCADSHVRRVMVIPNAEQGTLYDDLRETLRHVDDDGKRITVFTMQPLVGGNFRQEQLGFSMMAALGIRSDELP